MPQLQAQPFNYDETVSPDDNADFPRFTNFGQLTGSIYVGVGGDVVIVTQNNIPKTYKNVPSGTLLNVAARRVNATNSVDGARTSALNLLALYVV